MLSATTKCRGFQLLVSTHNNNRNNIRSCFRNNSIIQKYSNNNILKHNSNNIRTIYSNNDNTNENSSSHHHHQSNKENNSIVVDTSYLLQLQNNTSQLLNSTIGSWTRNDISMIRSILEHTLSSLSSSSSLNDQNNSNKNQNPFIVPNNNNDNNTLKDTLIATKLLIRWLNEYKSSLKSYNSVVIKETLSFYNNNTTTIHKKQLEEKNKYNELIEYLHRILHKYHSWLKENTKSNINTQQSPILLYEDSNKQRPRQYRNINHNNNQMNDSNNVQSPNIEMLSCVTKQAIELMEVFYNESSSSSRFVLSEKAYSIILELLVTEIKSYPNSVYTCLFYGNQYCHQLLLKTDSVKTRYNNSNNTSSDSRTTTMNSYLHLLTKASRYVPTLSYKVEEILLNAIYDIQKQQQQNSAISAVFIPNNKSYAIVLNAFTNEPDPVYQLLEKIKYEISKIKYNHNSNHNIDIVCYNICMRAYAQNGNAQKAEDILWKLHEDYMKQKMMNHSLKTEEYYIRPDQYSFLAVIDGYSKCQQPKHAKRVLEQLISLSKSDMYDDLYPTTEIYTAVMNAYSKQKDSGPYVEDILYQMENNIMNKDSSSCLPTRYTYTTVLSAWAQTTNDSNAPIRAEAIVKKMEEYRKNGYLHLSPNTITYTSLIQVYANNNGPYRALEILNYMNAINHPNCLPNIVTYNTVLGAFAKHGMANEAYQLLQEMIMINRSCNSDNNDIKKEACHNQVVQPNANSWTTVIQAYMKSGMNDAGYHAQNILHEMEQCFSNNQQQRHGNSDDITFQNGKDHYPNTSPYIATIYAFGQNGHYIEAENILWHMIHEYENRKKTKSDDENIIPPPTTQICNIILKLWANSNEPIASDHCDRIWNWMMKHIDDNNNNNNNNNIANNNENIHVDVVPNSKTIKYLIMVWKRSRRRVAMDRIDAIVNVVHTKLPILIPYLESYVKPSKSNYGHHSHTIPTKVSHFNET